MAVNRIADFLDLQPVADEAAQPVVEKGFAAIPTGAIPGLNDRWCELQQMYGMAFLMAQVDAGTRSVE